MSIVDDPKMREVFEKMTRRFRISDAQLQKDKDGDYTDKETASYWVVFGIAWAESREALVIELPAENPIGTGPGDCGDGRPSFEQHCAAECNFIIRDCREAIEAAGLKVKP